MKKYLPLLLLCGISTANAGLIAEYDFSAASGTSQVATTVNSNFTATSLSLNNSDNTATAFGNHFYMNGWDTTINLNKYYETTISSLASNFFLSDITFSLEEISDLASDWSFRTSSDGFSSDYSSGSFGGGLNAGEVTDFSIDMSSLGVLTSPLTLRWYMTSDNFSETAGFANHECPDEGCGLSDVGQDLVINGNISAVPVPAAVWLLGSGLIGLIGMRKKTSKLPVLSA